MSRLLVLASLGVWIGSALLLGETRWARRSDLVTRISPYLAGRPSAAPGAGVLSAGSFRDVLGPIAAQAGGSAARLLGVHEELGIRLVRVHAKTNAQAFRLRQAGWCVATLGTGAAIALVAAPPPTVALLLVLGAPALSFLIIEHRLLRASSQWQLRLFAELPVVTEQLGMLLSAGYSVGASLQRLASRGDGCVAQDLRRVCGRIRQGLSETEALAEWSEVARVDAVARLVGVLALNREAADLGRLVSDEARTTRREAHRRQIELIERRSQQVWIPVTVAALVPGVLFLAVPFMDAMRMFGAP